MRGGRGQGRNGWESDRPGDGNRAFIHYIGMARDIALPPLLSLRIDVSLPPPVPPALSDRPASRRVYAGNAITGSAELLVTEQSQLLDSPRLVDARSGTKCSHSDV